MTPDDLIALALAGALIAVAVVATVYVVCRPSRVDRDGRPRL